ncbi:MAG: recombinase family protein [Cetobacterium sp.]|uniref:recombinase family protein n=2 Tax=Cetobacterium sp. TaxID=2071632 RepID=UPI003EE5333A
MKVVTYLRVSTEMQKDRGSLETQRESLNEYCKKNNLNIIDSFEDVMSGGIADRDGILKIMAMLPLKKFEGVVVQNSDRVSRDFKDGTLFFNDFRKHNVRLISVMEGPLDFRDDNTDAMAKIRLIFSEMERRKMRIRTKVSMAALANTDRYLGGGLLPHFKVKIINKEKKIVKNEETWDLERQKYLDILKYRSFKKVAELYCINYSTFLEQVRKVELIGHRMFGEFIKDPYTLKKVKNKDPFISSEKVLPALLTDDEFNFINALLKDNRKKFKNPKRKYLFSGLLYCTCGKKFAGNIINKKTHSYYYYRCEGCKTFYNLDKLEINIKNAILSHPHLKLINDTTFRLQDLQDKIEFENKKLEDLVKKQREITQLLMDGLLDASTIKPELEKLKKLVDLSKQEIKKYENLILENSNFVITEDNISDLKELLFMENNDEIMEELQEILCLIINRIIIKTLEDIEIIF